MCSPYSYPADCKLSQLCVIQRCNLIYPTSSERIQGIHEDCGAGYEVAEEDEKKCHHSVGVSARPSTTRKTQIMGIGTWRSALHNKESDDDAGGGILLGDREDSAVTRDPLMMLMIVMKTMESGSATEDSTVTRDPLLNSAADCCCCCCTLTYPPVNPFKATHHT